ncbi:hypothetical protein AVEN_43290-1 [Araneus ventricosus]|uniref:Uncharacterized protein n=1 Tax=Araneus ventricosus TaxID=182803 RepID=A0A4Y2GDJ6_ARAVE|nr:hypothetical protein AVEN_43290-1 [Araneus ventricosus]
METLLTSFITPHQHQMLSHKQVRRYSQYKAFADEHNLINRKYAAFLKSSTKIRAYISSTSNQRRGGATHGEQRVSVSAPLMVPEPKVQL